MHLLPTLLFAATEATPISFVDASMYPLLISLIPLLPILGFAFTALFGRRLMPRFGPRRGRDRAGGLIVIAVWVIALRSSCPALTHAGAVRRAGPRPIKLWTWIPAGNFRSTSASTSTRSPPSLLLVVTTIGMLVHIYSIGYMAHDPATWRFFAYLNLFMFSMLVLVLASSWLLVFAGWELVGPVELLADRVLVPQAVRGARREEGVHRQPRRRRRVRARDHGDLREHRHDEHPGRRSPSSSHRRRPGRSRSRSRSSRCSCSRARWARAPSSRSTSGCRTRWRARPRSRP